jgi:hypothetical protein
MRESFKYKFQLKSSNHSLPEAAATTTEPIFIKMFEFFQLSINLWKKPFTGIQRLLNNICQCSKKKCAVKQYIVYFQQSRLFVCSSVALFDGRTIFDLQQKKH